MHSDTITEDTTSDSMLRNLWVWAIAIILVVVLGGVWILFSQTIAGGGLTGGDLEPAPNCRAPRAKF